MAVDTIRRLVFTPPVAIARLGGSSTAMAAFTWGPGDPHTIAETRIRPDWTLRVDADGSVTPELPTELRVRDGALIRPVAPFLELWALTGDGPAAGLTAVPVTAALLAANGVGERDLTFTVTAMNAKAARRAQNPALRFGTFPPVTLAGDDHAAVALRGTSPPGVATPMIPAGRSIPLGTVQVLRPKAPPADPAWPADVRVDVVLLRFTPGAGLAFGPPVAANPQPGLPAAIPAARAFLDPAAGWLNAARSGVVVPADTCDERTVQGQPRSLGVVDDTCDAVITVALTVPAGTLRARANVTVGPPHFAPDRRPFLSLADEINDRERDAARDAAMGDDERGRWVEDLFERIAETAALLDLDFWRAPDPANDSRYLVARLTGAALAAQSIPGDGVPGPQRALGGRDALRDREIAIPGPSEIEPFPLAARARERHRTLSDLGQLVPWILSHPDRLRALVRRPFRIGPGYRASFTMQMPPVMVNSNRWPLTLSHWQYDLLMAWADAVVAAGRADADAAPAPLSADADERRRQVLAVLDADQG